MRTSLSPHLQELLSQDVDPEDDAHYAQLRVGAGASPGLRLRPRGLELQLHPRLRRVGLGGDQVGPAGLEDHAGPVAVPAQGGRLGLDHPRDRTGCTKKKRMGLMASRCASWVLTCGTQVLRTVVLWEAGVVEGRSLPVSLWQLLSTIILLYNFTWGYGIPKFIKV